MHRSKRPSAPWTLCLVLAAGSSSALAAPPSAQPSESARKEEAKRHFEAGRELDAQGDAVGALREFTASRATYKTRGNTLNAALALRKLGRLGESLDLLDAYLKDFENLSSEDKAMVEGEIAATAQFIGKLEIDTSTSAQVVVDDVVRGKTPLTQPLRLAAGIHHVRLQPESFAARAFEARVAIVATQSTQLRPEFGELEEHGALNVRAADGGAYEILLDDTLVGATPLSLQLPPRDYTVVLRGPDRSGSAPTRVTVASSRLAEIAPRTSKLDAWFDVRVEPPDAKLFFDGVPVARGHWSGATTRGQHELRAEADGYQTKTVRAELTGGHADLRVDLRRGGPARSSDAPSTSRGFGGFAELDLGLSLGLLAGGHLRADCTGTCSSSLLLGPKMAVRAGLTIDKRFEIGSELAFLHVSEHVEQRADTVSVVGRTQVAPGISNDVLKWNSVAMGVVGGVRLGPAKVPVTLRVAAGVMVGSVADRRDGSFDAGAGLELAQAAESRQAATHFYVAPEVRVGYAFTEHVSAGLGLRGTFAFDLAVPRWDTKKPTVLERSGLAYWDRGVGAGSTGERLMGGVRILLDPSVYVRYDF